MNSKPNFEAGWWAEKKGIEEEIRAHLQKQIESKRFLPSKDMPIWYLTGGGSNLRLNDFGFKYYCEIHTPFKIELSLIMTGKRMIDLIRIMDCSPWYYERKFRSSTMHHIIYLWSEPKYVSWVLCGQDWDSWVTLSS